MTLKEKISKDYIEAFKAKNTVAKNLLSVIKGEIQTLEKNTGVESLSDEDVTKILNKSVKSLKETISSLTDVDKLAEVQSELNIVETYLPKQLSVEEIQSNVEFFFVLPWIKRAERFLWRCSQIDSNEFVDRWKFGS